MNIRIVRDHLEPEIEHSFSKESPGSRKSATYIWKSSAGPKLYITVTFDEFHTIEGFIANHEASGSSMHNVCNALGRMISLGIQKVRRVDPDGLTEYIEKQIANLSGFNSETMWMHDTMGAVLSIPDVFAKILERHLEVTEAIEEIHSGEEENE